MIKKRVIGVVTVRQGLAVQSFGYSRYLPLGKPEYIIENLDRWGADEIFIQCIDCSANKLGPNLELLSSVSALGLSTPLIYGGGIRNADDAVKAVSFGADRISVDTLLWDAPYELENISRALGTQALIASMPIRVHEERLYWLNYKERKEIILSEEVFSRLSLKWVSELMLIDWEHEGVKGGFDIRIPQIFPITKQALIVFGGLSETSHLLNMLSEPRVVGVGVGNFLCYKEHAIQKIKQNLIGVPIRTAQYFD